MIDTDDSDITATICTSLNSYSRDLQINFNQGGTVFSKLTESKNKELNKVIHWRAELADPCCQSITAKSSTVKPDKEGRKKSEKRFPNTIRPAQWEGKRQRKHMCLSGALLSCSCSSRLSQYIFSLNSPVHSKEVSYVCLPADNHLN